MSDQEEISQSDIPKQRNIDKFANIIKEKKVKEKDFKKKSVAIKPLTENERSESFSKSSKSKVMDNSYVSAKPSKKDPSIFKFEDDSDASVDEGFKILNNNKEKGPKKIEINRNVVEDMRKQKENQEKEKQEKLLREQEELEKRDLVNDLTERTVNSWHQLNIEQHENDKLRGNRRLSNYSEKKDINDPQELITSLKDKNFKDEMTGLLERSFDNHFAHVKDLDEENDKAHQLLSHIENHDREKKQRLSRFSKDLHLESKKGGEIENEDVFRTDESVYYSEYVEGEREFRPMHLDVYNRFYKSDYYRKHVFLEHDPVNNMRIENKDSLLFKSRLINNYFNTKSNISLPKFTKVSEKDRKCQEIMKFTENGVEEKGKTFYDRCVCLELRRKYYKLESRISLRCRFIVQNVVFDNISLTIILVNTFLILISDPIQENSIANTSDPYFLYIFSAELVLKVCSYGFVIPDGAYLRDSWNIIDFIVVVIGWVSFILERAMNGKKVSGLSGLRAFRILRPLKTVKSIKGLRSLIVTLLESMMALSDIFIVLFFFFLIFAIAGVQMWQGLTLKRCMSLNLGYFYDSANYTTMCSYDTDCTLYSSPGNIFICAKSYMNPNFDITHFDNTIASLITVFIIASMEGWSDIWDYVNQVFKDTLGINAVIIFLYFHVLLFVGGYYLINLFLAVIKTNFTYFSNVNKEKNEKKKQNFYDMIEEKYNLKIDDKEIQNKLKKGTKNPEEEAIKKLRSQFVFIKKNDADIRINYNTLKDVLVIKTMSPEEQYDLSNKVNKESKSIQTEFKKKVKTIKLYARSKSVNSGTLNNLVSPSKKLAKKKNSIRKKGQVIFLEEAEILINKKFIQPSIHETVKWFEQDLVEKKKVEKKSQKEENTVLKKRQLKAQKKVDEKKEISLKQDISFDIEMTKLQLIKTDKINLEKSQRKNSATNLLGLTNAYTNISRSGLKKTPSYPDPNNPDNPDNPNNPNNNNKENTQLTSPSKSPKKHKKLKEIRKNIFNIEDELSFCSDNTEDEIEEDIKREIEDTNFQSRKNSTFSKDVPNGISSSHKKVSNNLITKKSLVDQKNSIFNSVTIKRPFSLISNLLRHKDEIIWKKKIDEKRKRFNVDEYISKLKPVQINKIGRRKSFLKLLQFIDDKSNYDDFNFMNEKQANEPSSTPNYEDNNKSLEISLFDEDNLQADLNSNSDLDMMPSAIANDERNFDEDMDYEEKNRKNENNKIVRLVRNSMFENKYRIRGGSMNNNSQEGGSLYNKITFNMINNIVIDMKETVKGLSKQQTKITKSNSIHDAPEKPNMNKSEDNSASNLKPSHRKAPSVEKNYYKYPQNNNREPNTGGDFESKKEVDITVKEKKDKVPDHLREKRKYLNYLFNIKDKDISVQDVFKADYWREDVLGPTIKEIEQMPKPADRNPVFVFNDSRLNLKTYNYMRYRPFEFLDDEYINYNHNLIELNPKVLEIFPPKDKNFRMIRSERKKRNFSTSEVQKSLTRTHINYKATKKQITPSQSSFGSALHRNKSAIGNSSLNTINYLFLQDIIKIKKATWKKVHLKLNDFNFKTFSHYFLEDERLINKIALNDDHRPQVFTVLSGKDKVLEIKQQIEKIRVYDIETNSRKYIEWSGQQVLNLNDDPEKYEEWNSMIKNLEEFNVILWKQGVIKSIMQKVRYVFYLISISPTFDLMIICFVILNACVMALDGNLLDPVSLANVVISNYAFNGIFIMEFVVKFIGLGPIIYFSDPFTYLDVFIIGFAVLDMTTTSAVSTTTNSKSNISSQLGFLRVFRIFRVLRLTKVLRKIKAMKKIIKGIKTSLENVSYIILILIIFILIFQLLGMSLLNSNANYQSFLASFYVTFQVLSIENWNSVAYQLMPENRLSIIYLVIWIVLGNYIIFNLFISVLLDSFDDAGLDEDEEEEELNAYQRKIKNMLPEIFDKHEQSEKVHRSRNRQRKNKKKKVEDNLSKNVDEKSNSMSVSQDMANSTSNIFNNSDDEEKDGNYQMDPDEEDFENNISLSTKILKKWDKDNNLFRGTDCEYSLFIFPQTSRIRNWLLKLALHKKFDEFILFMIMLSTLRLVLDTFLSGYKSDFLFAMVDIGFTFIFFFEMLTKVTAFGFVLDEGTYLRDNWNKIDFLIVCVSLIDLQGLILKYLGGVSGGSLSFLKVLRLLRLLRPLRFISHNVQLKLIITSLFDSIVPIMNVLFVVMVVFFMFSIVGMNLFYDMYHSCYLPDSINPFNPINTFKDQLSELNIPADEASVQAFCNSLGGTMDAISYYTFSNLINSMISCYVLSNMEGWPNIMYNYNQYNKFYGIFFVAYLIVVSYFFMNLFIGIMFNCFNETWTKEKRKGIMNNQAAEKYWDFLKQIEFAKPEYSTFKKPEKGIRKVLFEISTSKYLDNFIMVIIIMNMILMAVSFEGSTDSFNSLLDSINLVFTAIFIIECTVKLSANGVKGYFYYAWNKFDFFVVASSVVDITVTNTTGANSAFLKSFQIIRVLRVLRVTRVLRLVKSLKGLERLLQTLRWSMNALSNIFILLFLIFSIFSIMGCYLYDGIKYADYQAGLININPSFNFDSYYHSFLLTFRQVTGESWPDTMNEMANVAPNVIGPGTAFFYMIFSNFICCVIMLNLFILVTLQQYDEFVNKKENPIEKFSELLDSFKKSWNKFSADKDLGFKIKHNQVSDFLMEFDWQEMTLRKKVDEIKIYIMDMELLKYTLLNLIFNRDHKNYVYFHDVLFRLIKREVGGKVGEQIPNITKEEDRLVKHIKYQIQIHIRNSEQNKNRVANPLNKFNPLTSHLYFKTSFLFMKTYMNYYKKLDDQQKRQGYELVNEDEYNLDNSGSSDMNSLSLGSAKNESGSASASDRSKDDNKKEEDVETGRAQSPGLILQNVSLKEAGKANQDESNYINAKYNSEDKLVIKDNRF